MTSETQQEKTLLILNPAAGKGKGKAHFPAVAERLQSAFPGLETEVSRYPGHIMELSRQAVHQGFVRIITIGGDGTPFEVVNGIYADGEPQRKIQLAMIPAGTGNSFLRDFDHVSQETWVQRILTGRARKVDLVRFSYFNGTKEVVKYYLNILGVGLIADILKLTNERLKFLGAMGYSAAVLMRLFKGMHNRIRLTVDGEERVLLNSALVISNSKYTGGDMKIAPMADVSDGKADLIVFNGVNRREILAIFAGVFKGKHVDHAKVDIMKGSEIRIEAEPRQLVMADGELLGSTPLNVRVLPDHLEILM